MGRSDAVIDAQAKFWRLRRSELLSDLADPEIRDLGALCEIRVLERGAAVYAPGDPADRVFLVESGAVKLSRTVAEKTIIVAVLGPMDIFGEAALSGEARRIDAASAIDDAVVCAIEQGKFEAFLVAHPNLAVRYTKLVGERLRRIETRIQDILFKDVRTRLAHAIVGLSSRFGEPVAKGRRINLRLTQTDLAQLIGSTRETTSTMFNELRREGLLDNDGYHIIVLDPEALSSI